MKAIFSTEKVYDLSGATVQIRLKMFNKVVFKSSFKPTLNPV